MTSLKGMITAAKSGKSLVVSGPHFEWVERPETEQRYSPAAVLHAIKVYLRLYKRPRKGRISASAIGGCSRAAVFGYANAPQVVTELVGQEIFDHGSTQHLKWQMEGLTVGWLEGAEVWVEDKDLRVGGSMDGDMGEPGIFELKSAASTKYNRIIKDEGVPLTENVWQLQTYMMLKGRSAGSLLYEDRSFGRFHEFRLQASGTYEREILRRLRSLNRYIEEDDLPPMLPDCEIKYGKQYKDCFFRTFCPTVSTVSEAEAAGVAAGTEDSGLIVADGDVLPDWILKVMKTLEEEINAPA